MEQADVIGASQSNLFGSSVTCLCNNGINYWSRSQSSNNGQDSLVQIVVEPSYRLLLLGLGSTSNMSDEILQISDCLNGVFRYIYMSKRHYQAYQIQMETYR